jgi:hypothetical protein
MSDRRKGFYISKYMKEEDSSDEETTEYYKKQLIEKEKEIEKKTTPKKHIVWKYIKPPAPARLTISPEIKKEYVFTDRSIEKSILGDYLFIKYLMKKTDNACFIYPNFNLSIDAIKLFYDIQEKTNIPFTKDILDDWDNIDIQIKKYPILYEKYIQTYDIVKDNYTQIKNILKPNLQGPRLKSDNTYYDKLIYSLLERMMENQRILFDTSGKEEYKIPYVSRLQQCLKSGKRYIVFFVRLKIKDEYHANVIIMDTKEKKVERFEPQGLEHGFYDNDITDKIIKKYFDKLGYKYIGTSHLCPYGVQDIVERYSMDEYQLSGFCKSWSFLYALLRLFHSEEVDRKDISKFMVQLVGDMAKDYFEERYKKKVSPIDEKDYDYVIEFLYDYIPEIIEDGKEDIEKMNATLGTGIVLEGRTIRSRS